MYNRYFLWQFAGRGPTSESGVTPMGANSREDGVDWSQFGMPLAFLIGLLGMFYHGSKDQRMSFSVMSLFLLNQRKQRGLKGLLQEEEIKNYLIFLIKNNCQIEKKKNFLIML